MTTYINLFGSNGYSVELVTEFAKDLVWEDRTSTLQIQPYISMKQFIRGYK